MIQKRRPRWRLPFCRSLHGSAALVALAASLVAVCAPSRAVADADPGEGVAGRANELIVAMEYDKARADLAKADPNSPAVAMAKADGYVETATDKTELDKQWPQLKAQFLIDRDGIVRWANIECSEGVAAVGKFPSAEEILTAARALRN